MVEDKNSSEKGNKYSAKINILHIITLSLLL
jgi:hypothetical protein